MNPSILLVGLEDQFESTLERQAHSGSWNWTRVDSPYEALNLACRQDFTLVISGLTLPYMDGIELLTRLKEMNPHMVRLLAAGRMDANAAMAAINQTGVYRLLALPLDAGEAVACIESAHRHAMEGRKHLQNQQRLEHQKEVYQALIRKSVARGQEIQKAYSDLDRSYAMAVDTLGKLLKLSNPGLWGHCARVAGYAEKLGLVMDLNLDHMEQLVVAAILHDIGKWCLPAKIAACDPVQLTEPERKALQKSPELGAMLVGNIDRYIPAALMIQYHQERMNGTGYPGGFAGEKIPFGARILAILDAFDQLLHPANGKPCSMEDAFVALEACGGYDPEILATWKQVCLPHHPMPTETAQPDWNRTMGAALGISDGDRPLDAQLPRRRKPPGQPVSCESIILDWHVPVPPGPISGVGPGVVPAELERDEAENPTLRRPGLRNVLPLPTPEAGFALSVLNRMPSLGRRRFREVTVSIDHLKPGMIIARDILADNGSLLLSRGTVITPERREQLRRYMLNNHLGGTISVYDASLLMIS